MDRPLQTHLYAGLIVYRSQRHIEFLLVNDSFTNKKHWFCPKGLVLGQEDELKCALRETFETTGLGPRLLRIEEGFKIELKYLSGTKPKKVVYYLAQLVDNHARLLPNAEGVHLQWCNQHVASEKVVFKSMQDVFSHAQHFVEIKKVNNRQPFNHHGTTNGGKRSNFIGQGQQQQHQQHFKSTAAMANTIGNRGYMGSSESAGSTNGNGNGLLRQHQQPRMTDRPSSAPVFRSSPSPPTSSPLTNSLTEGTTHGNHANNANPLFKTRLCERFETDGECPYGPRCTFAHGTVELRGRLNGHDGQGNGGSSTSDLPANMASTTPLLVSTGADDSGRRENGTHAPSKDLTENLLYKTKLCERYMKDQFCQYGPKCHFAHGRSELKERPNQQQQQPQQQQPQQQHHHHQNQNQERHHSTEDTLTPHPVAQPDPNLPNSGATPSYTQQRTGRDQHQNGTKDIKSRDYSWRSSPAPLRHTPAETSAPHLGLSELTLNEKEKSPSIRQATLNQNAPEQKQPLHGHQQQEPKQKLQHQNQQYTQPRPHSQPQFPTQPEPEAQLPVRPQPQHPTLTSGTTTKKRTTASDPDQVLNGDIMQTDKSWMKVVHLTKEEQAKLAIPPSIKTPSPTPTNKSKVAQEQAIIDELAHFFQSPESNITQERTQNIIAKDVKQVTKVEMRHDLTKSQLFYILLVSLLQNSVECPVGAILRSRERLFKTFVKSISDQRLLLKAWDQCTQRYPLVLPKTALVLSQWYECDLLDEDACYAWYEGLEPHRDLTKKTTKFIDWLKTADEEEDD